MIPMAISGLLPRGGKRPVPSAAEWGSVLPREAVSRPRMWPQLRSCGLRAVNAGGALHRALYEREL